jgi:hypothetical protein
MPDSEGLHETHFQIVQAAATLIDALQGKHILKDINLYRLQSEIAPIGYVFNRIVKSVNMGKPDLTELPPTLDAITHSANTIIATLNGQPVLSDEELLERAMDEMRANMHKRGDA